MGVEARRHEHQIGREAFDGRRDDLGERAQVLRIARACVERNVHGRLALLVGTTTARVERPLVKRHEQDRVVFPEDLLRSVAVMHVVVDDRDAVTVGLRRPRRDRDVVEDTEAHRPSAERVMSGRADEREAACARRLDRSSGREQSGGRCRLADDRVGIEPTHGVDREHAFYMFTRVTPKHFVHRRGSSLGPGRKRVEQRRQPLRRLGMAERRMQARERRMRQDVDRRTASVELGERAAFSICTTSRRWNRSARVSTEPRRPLARSYAASAAILSACAFIPSCLTKEDAPVQLGV